MMERLSLLIYFLTSSNNNSNNNSIGAVPRIEEIPILRATAGRPPYSHNGWLYRTSKNSQLPTRFFPRYIPSHQHQPSSQES